MPLNITDGALSWAASIDTEDFDKKLDQMDHHLHETVQNATGEVKSMGGAMNTVADHVHDVMEGANQAIKETAKNSSLLGNIAKDAIPSWKELNGLFHGIFAARFGHGEGMKVMSEWNKEMKAGTLTFEEFIKRLNLTEAEVGKVAAKIQGMAQAGSSSFAGLASSGGKNLTQLQAQLARFQEGLKNTSNPESIARLNRAIEATQARIGSMSGGQGARAFEGLRQGAHAANEEIKQTESLANKAATAIGAYLSLTAIKGFVSDMVQVRAEFEMLEISFRTMLQSKEKADKLMAEVTQLAATTPFTLQDVASGAKQLLSYGFEADKVTDVLKRMGDVAAGTGTDIDGLILALGQVKTKGKLQSQEMYQFAERGVPIIKELAKQFNVADSAIAKMVEDGQVGFNDVYKAIENMTNQGGLFFNLTAEQAKSLGGQLSNLKDSYNLMLNDLGRSNEGLLTGSIGVIKTLIDNYQTVLDILKVLIATYGTYKAAVIANTVAVKVYDVATKQLSISQTLQATASSIGTRAMRALNTAMKENPAILIASAVGTLVAALVIFNRVNHESAEAMREYNKELEKEQKTLGSMVDAAKSAAEGSQKRADAIAQINKNYGEYLPQLLSEKTTNQELVTTYELLNKKISENMALKFKSKAMDKVADRYANIEAKYPVDRIIESIASSKGQKAAGKAAAEAQDVIEQISRVFDNLNDLKKQGREGTKTYNDLLQIPYKLAKEWGDKWGVFEVAFTNLIDVGRIKAEMNTDLKKIDDYWTAFINAGKTGADDAKKDLEDYLKEKDFAAVFDKAMSLAEGKEDLDKILKRLVSDKGAVDPNAKDFEAQVSRYQVLIDKVQLAIDRYDPNKTAKKNAKAANELAGQESKLNALLKAREDILLAIGNARKMADAEGNGKQASEIEKINQKYADLINKVDAYNKKVEDWNKDPKHKTKVPGIGDDAKQQIRDARQIEINQELMQEDVKNYETALNDKRDLYKQYEADVKEMGKQDADKLYDKDKLAFDSYLDYLKFELGKFGTQISVGIPLNFADKEKMKLLSTELKQVTKDMTDEQVAQYKRVILATMSAADQRKAIEEQYNRDVEALGKKYSGEDFERRKALLKQAKDEDLVMLAENLSKQGAMYRKLNADVYQMARTRIDDEIKLLEDQLKAIGDSDPALAADIQRSIEKWKALRHQLNGTMDDLDKVISTASELAPAFGDLAQVVGSMNEELGASINLISDMIGGVGRAATAFKKFQEAQKMVFPEGTKNAGKLTTEGVLGSISGAMGIVSATVGVISAIDSFARKVNERRTQERQAEIQHQLDIYKGEVEINMLYRQRAQEQVLINKLRLEGLEAEARLLEENKAKNLADIQDVFAQLAKVQDTRAAVLGTADQFPYASKTFEELQKLDAQGLLKDKAKQLFDILQKLHDEGVNIDKAIEDSKQKIKETFTATTADSIADSIIQGLKAGKRGIKDFADSFQELMQGALLNALKYQTLEAPLKAFYEEFYAAAKSDGALTKEEIASLQQQYNDLIVAAGKQFEDIQKVTGVSFNSSTSAATNSLQGAIKGMTEQTAELLAGQFAGQRLATLELLKVAQTNLAIQNRIQSNTFNTVTGLKEVVETLKFYYTNGIKVK